METIKFIFFGIIMGVANVIPGVSGGTMALILNFYDRLMESITLDLKVVFKNLPFLIPLGVGVIIGIVGLSSVMDLLFTDYPQQTYFGFIGIVFGSLPLIYSKAKKEEEIQGKSWILFVIALVLMIALTFANGDKASGEVLFTTLTPLSFIVCVVSMAVASITMLIPGISGSLVLIIIGMYQTIYIEGVANMNIGLLIPIVIGAAIGILGGAKLIRFLMSRFYQFTYMAILGLLVGSIIQLMSTCGFTGFNATFMVSMVVAIICFSIVYWFSLQEINRDKKEKLQ